MDEIRDYSVGQLLRGVFRIVLGRNAMSDDADSRRNGWHTACI
jgi:hypothetical protein